MSLIERVRVSFTGSQVVGPAIATHYFTSGSADPAATLAFWNAVKALFPVGVDITVPNSGDVINDTNGVITAAWAVAGGGTVTGTGTGAFVLGTGTRIVWETEAITNGRHVRGSTFLVPLVGSAFDASGRLTTTAKSTVTSAGNTFLTANPGQVVVWTRPRPGVNGKSSAITTVAVSEQPSWLRSRRV